MYMEKQASQAVSPCKPLTTFVQTDTNTFREVVQRLTGPSESNAAQEGEGTKVVGVKRPTSKLHERRQYARPKLEITRPAFPLKPGTSANQQPCFSPCKSANSSFHPSPISGNSSHLTSPITPSTIFSKLSLWEEDRKEETAIPEINPEEEEEKAIKERRFYLHPSPRFKPGHTKPELLPLFPLTSPRASEAQ